MIDLLRPTTVGSHTVVTIAGEVDIACANELRDGLLGLVNRGVSSLVVDLRPVTFIDSTGVGCLLRVFHRQTLMGGAIHFLADQPCVLRVFELMQLDRRLHVAPDVAGVDLCCPGLSTLLADPAGAAAGAPG
jgi:anti-sigma B factor antagonist